MPVYSYHCKKCDMEWESFNKIDNRHSEHCDVCNEIAEIWISPTAKPVIHEYYSENLDAIVTGPKHRERLMKEKGLESVG